MAEATSTSAGMPALFIYIPTYNRLATLKLQLDALTAQRDAYPGPVRILVSDNASPAITDEQLSALAQEYGIEVRRNPGNIGANANIALGFIFADPEGLLWILSDDDTVSPDALSYIAEHCQGVDYDIITFYTKITEPGEFTHRWVRAWEDLHETGLISNVIYKASVFLPEARQAFLYHNTSFPHLAVMLATLRERGELRYRLLPSSRLLTVATSHAEEPGDYSLSYSGMPQIIPLLPAAQARVFARQWVRSSGRGFLKSRDSLPGAYVSTRAHIKRFGGLRARLMLAALRIEHATYGPTLHRALDAIRRRLPNSAKDSLRSLMDRRRGR